MGRRKPQSGKCGLCGRAVVVEDNQGPQTIGTVLYWQGGHCYEWDERESTWRLAAVRCDYHTDLLVQPSTSG